MAILSITTDEGINPRIIRVVTTDDFNTITTSGYLVDQDENIQLLQNGEFEWFPTDGVLISYSDGQGFFTHNAEEQRFDVEIPTETVVVAQRTITASGNYIPTPGMTFCIIEAIGGGGAGGGTSTAAAGTGYAGGGGGAGSYGRGIYTAAQIGTSQVVTIGAGGTPVANDDGNPGGTTSVGTLLVANGGLGGLSTGVATAGFNGAQGGAGGAAGTGGAVNSRGAPGFNSFYVGVSASISGAGGATRLGGSGNSLVAIGSNNIGSPAQDNTGSGGGGSAIQGVTGAPTLGGAGGSGVVLITEYI